jgi:hypothetical protein
MIKTVIIALFLIQLVSASYFRKERIVSIQELEKPNQTIDIFSSNLRGFNKILKVDTDNGNTYIIKNDEDGIQITDANITDDWKIKNNFSLRGLKTVNDIIVKLEKKLGDKKAVAKRYFRS